MKYSSYLAFCLAVGMSLNISAQSATLKDITKVVIIDQDPVLAQVDPNGEVVEILMYLPEYFESTLDDESYIKAAIGNFITAYREALEVNFFIDDLSVAGLMAETDPYQQIYYYLSEELSMPASALGDVLTARVESSDLPSFRPID